jgi:hypothetical protein
MSERMTAPDDPIIEDFEGIREEDTGDPWATGDRYSLMKIDAGAMGGDFYFSLPTFTILVKTEEELTTLNEDFSELFSKYTDQIIVGSPHEASLILSLNQASADLSVQHDAIEFLRNKIHELTGSYEAAGDWQDKD